MYLPNCAHKKYLPGQGVTSTCTFLFHSVNPCKHRRVVVVRSVCCLRHIWAYLLSWSYVLIKMSHNQNIVMCFSEKPKREFCQLCKHVQYWTLVTKKWKGVVAYTAGLHQIFLLATLPPRCDPVDLLNSRDLVNTSIAGNWSDKLSSTEWYLCTWTYSRNFCKYILLQLDHVIFPLPSVGDIM